MDLCAQASHSCYRLLRMSPTMQTLMLVSARNRQLQWRELSGKRSHVVMATGHCRFWQRSQAFPCFNHWPNFCVLPMGWGSRSLWFPPAAQPKSHVHKTLLSRRLWDGRALGSPCTWACSRRTGVALGVQGHSPMLLSVALRVSAAPGPLLMEMRPELKMQSVQRYFNGDLTLNPCYGKPKKWFACNKVL